MCYSIITPSEFTLPLKDRSRIKEPKDRCLCTNTNIWHMLIFHRFTILIMLCTQMAFAGVSESIFEKSQWSKQSYFHCTIRENWWINTIRYNFLKWLVSWDAPFGQNLSGDQKDQLILEIMVSIYTWKTRYSERSALTTPRMEEITKPSCLSWICWLIWWSCRYY